MDFQAQQLCMAYTHLPTRFKPSLIYLGYLRQYIHYINGCDNTLFIDEYQEKCLDIIGADTLVSPELISIHA